MDDDSGKKTGISCCLVSFLSIVCVIVVVYVTVQSFFLAFFWALSPSGSQYYAGDGTYRVPLRGEAEISCYYGMRVLPEVYGDSLPRMHNGVDYYAYYGREVVAARGGTVSTYETTGGGITLVIDHGDGEETRYLHLSRYIAHDGDIVEQGQPIAYSGDSGTQTTGPHLHFEVRVNGRPIDPMTVLTPWED